MKTINWGIIGCGGIAKSFIEALKSLPETRIAAVASTSLEKAKNYSKIYSVPKFYGSYEELAADAEIDVVYIANSHSFHKESTLICLNHEKAVLCEKPLTVNAFETEELIRVAREKNVFLMEAMWTQFLPAIQRLRELLKEGVIGDVRMLYADFGFKTEPNPESRILSRNLAGGALLDVGIYPITLASIVFGKEPVQMQSSAHIGDTGVDESSSYLFTYDQGEMAILSSAVTLATPRTATIIGSKGMIQIPAFWMATQLVIQLENKKPITYKFPFHKNGYEYEAMEVMNCLKNGEKESSLMPLKNSLTIMQTMDKLRTQWGLKYRGE